MASVAERAPGGGGRSGRVFEFLALLLVLAGVAARLRHLSTNRSLWLDESMLAWNILFVPARRLFGPLSLPLASTAVGRAVVVFAGLAIVASEAGHRPWRHVIDPPPIDNLHPVLETLAKRWRPGENVVVHFRAWAAFGLYSRLLDLPDFDARRFGEWPAAPAAGRSGDDAGGSTTSLAELPVEGRAWYVAVWKSRKEKQEQRAHRARLAQGGEQLDAFTDVGAGAWLFDLGPPINRSAEFR